MIRNFCFSIKERTRKWFFSISFGFRLFIHGNPWYFFWTDQWYFVGVDAAFGCRVRPGACLKSLHLVHAGFAPWTRGRVTAVARPQ